MVLVVMVLVQCRVVTSVARLPRAGRRLGSDSGQTTAEYALVLIGAAALALLLIAWATRTDRVGKLFDFVMDHITGRVQ